MNLHAIAGPIIGSVNPAVPAILLRSNGYVINPDYSRTPTYEQQQVTAQVQAMSGGDLRQVEGLNLNGTKRSVYLYGHANGTVRVSGKGGDILAFLDGPRIVRSWLTNIVLEQWPQWVKIAVVQQDDTMSAAFQAFGQNQDTPALITLSAQGAGVVTSSDQVNAGYQGLIAGISLTTVNSASVAVHIQGKDVASGDYYDLFVAGPFTTTGFTPLTVYPGILSTSGTYPSPLPATWRYQVIVTGASAIVSGTLGASLLQ
jgi:hypothetical protein